MFTQVKSWIKEHPYCLLLTYWIFYLLYFELLEHIAVPSYIIYSPLDDLIPFNEFFVIPYLLWFPLLVLPLGYFLFHSKKDFQDLCFFMFTGMSFCLLVYTIFPNGLNLRVPITATNLCARLVGFLQSIDSPTNVCPSIHVSSTVAICIVVWKYQGFHHAKAIKISTILLSVMIILATMFIKQHSIIDVILGIALSGVLYLVTYHFPWRKLFGHGRFSKLIN
ncbi:phosphatase PAP2 family protein [[Eubacterium] hominis]|uniref:phosphatase PAP2 family protein n=1 Tax=[Eubacterium] hominis TaxID=2764325 RepID=UPI003A4D4029